MNSSLQRTRHRAVPLNSNYLGFILRLTPAQIGVQLICGAEWMPHYSQLTMRQRIRDGRNMLRSISGQDFGYDLLAWHNHLKASRAGGYTWGRNIVLPRIMKAALASPEWQRVVAVLQNTA